MPYTNPTGWPQIGELSSLDAEDFKDRNRRFLRDPDQPYESGIYTTKAELDNKISNVRNGDLRKLMRRFPRDQPLRDQCALWMHAVVGKHFFPDANHRTAVALLRNLLAENGIDFKPWSAERAENARRLSHEVRADIEPVHLDTLYRHDELYDVWRDFFEKELQVTNARG